MSKIWDALKKAELEREPVIADAEGDAAPTALLTGKQRAALQALLTSATFADACNLSGISERTMQRWLRRPGFIAAYHSASRAAFGDSIAQLKAASRQATEVLRAALVDGDAALRVRAAEAIVNAASRLELAAAVAQSARRERPAKK